MAFHFLLYQTLPRGFRGCTFDTEEVTKAVHDCYGNKMPGPDAMTMVFLQAKRDIVRGHVLTMFSEFFTNEKFAASLDATFVGLVPKKANGENMSSVSLIGCIYELLSKVLAHRLRSLIADLISDNQNGFVGGLLLISLLTAGPSQLSQGCLQVRN